MLARSWQQGSLKGCGLRERKASLEILGLKDQNSLILRYLPLAVETMFHTLGLQLYSLREDFARDPEATLLRVPELGFGAIETAGDYGWDHEQWTKLMKDTGLKATGCHLSLDQLTEHYEKSVEFARMLGADFATLPSIPKESQTREGYLQIAGLLNELAPRLAKEDLQLLYHHHDFEFSALKEGGTGMEILLTETDPALVGFEIDTYWVERGGLNSLDFISQNQARIKALHLKDYSKAIGMDTSVGAGDIEFPAILEIAKRHDWALIVEYEGPDAPAAVEAGATFVRKHL